MRTMDRPLTMKSQMGGAVIIRCIYKSETTSPERLSSLPSHCIIPPFGSCQLAPALLINCTTESRWTARGNKETTHNFPCDHLYFRCLDPGTQSAWLAPPTFHTEHIPTCSHLRQKKEWPLQRGERVGTICDVCKRETFRLTQELDWVGKK